MSLFWNIWNRIICIFKKRPHGTLRSMFLLIAIVFLTASVLAATNVSYVSYIRLQVNRAVMQSEDTALIDIYAYAHVPVNAVDVTLRFTGTAVEVVGIDRDESVLTDWTKDPVIKKNEVILSGVTFREGFMGEHKLATLELRAVKLGQSKFTVDHVMLLAKDGVPVMVAESNKSTASIYVYDKNTSLEDIKVDLVVREVSDLNNDHRVTFRNVKMSLTAWIDKIKLLI